MLEEQDYTAAHLPLGPGDLLLTYTDGVTEATDPELQLYGAARLDAVGAAEGARGPEHLVASLLAQRDAFAAGRDPADDITMLAQRGVA